MRGRRNRLIVLLAGLALVGAWLTPAVQARGKAAFVLVEAVGGEVPRPFAAGVEHRETQIAGGTVDVYAPPKPAPLIVLVPGAAPAGRSDPRVVRLALALARASRVVVVPELDLFDGDFTEQDLDFLARLVPALQADPMASAAGVVLLGFSFGGSFALLTAADERAREHLRLVVTFGAYADMVGLIQAATTGVAVVGGERFAWQPPPEAAAALQKLALALVPAADRALLARVLAGTGDLDELSAQARTVVELVTNTDPDRTQEIVGSLSAESHARLARFSPVEVASQITTPVLAIHARDDPVVPWAELLRIRMALPDAKTTTVASFTHVDLVSDGWGRALPDLRRVWARTADLVEAQESWFD